MRGCDVRIVEFWKWRRGYWRMCDRWSQPASRLFDVEGRLLDPRFSYTLARVTLMNGQTLTVRPKPPRFEPARAAPAH